MKNEGAYVYIMANSQKITFYIGITNNLPNRVHQHKFSFGSTFTHKHNCRSLMFFEYYDTIKEAESRADYIKNQSNEWKETLIRQHNPKMKDLTTEIAGNI